MARNAQIWLGVAVVAVVCGLVRLGSKPGIVDPYTTVAAPAVRTPASAAATDAAATWPCLVRHLTAKDAWGREFAEALSEPGIPELLADKRRQLVFSSFAEKLCVIGRADGAGAARATARLEAEVSGFSPDPGLHAVRAGMAVADADAQYPTVYGISIAQTLDFAAPPTVDGNGCPVGDQLSADGTTCLRPVRVSPEQAAEFNARQQAKRDMEEAVEQGVRDAIRHDRLLHGEAP